MIACKHTLTLLVASFALLSTQLADAQPGATPPGTVPPYPPAGPPPGPPPASPPPGPAAPAPYYAPPPPAYPQAPIPAPPRGREGWQLGASFGIGALSDSTGLFDCPNCESGPAAVGFDFHVGSMISTKLALQGELWVQSRAMDDSGESSLGQSMYLLAAQYWFSPRFWIKAGLGLATLNATYDPSSQGRPADISDAGSAMMGAVGYEIVHSRGFGFDVQLKTGAGLYEELELSTTVLALGVNWY